MFHTERSGKKIGAYPLSTRRRAVAFGLLLGTYMAMQALAMQTCRRQEEARRQPYGRFTAAQAIARTRQICVELVPPHTAIYLTAGRANALQRNGSPFRAWHIDCADRQGHYLAFVSLDADSGQVNMVGSAVTLPGKMQRSFPHAALQRKAEWWLALLGFADRWMPDSAPHRTGPTWQLALHSSERRALLVLDARDGQLRYARVQPAR